MEDGRGGLYFLNELSGYPESYSGSSYSPLAKVPVQGYLTAEEDKALREFGLPFEQHAPQPLACSLAVSDFGSTVQSGFSLPFKSVFNGGDSELCRGCIDQEPLTQANLQSVESTLSTYEYPSTPCKFYTEPVKPQEPSPFSLASLDFLDEAGRNLPAPERSTRMKVVTAPANVLLARCAADFAERDSQNANELSTHGVPRSSGGQCLQASEGASMSSSTANCFSMGGVNFAAADLADGDLRVGLGEVRGGSLPPMRAGRNQLLASAPSRSCEQLDMEEGPGQEVSKTSDKTGTNPRKTEQNRRAQARFRQRKKDMFCDQKRQIQNLTARLEQVLKEKRSYEEKSSHLQQLVDAKEKKIETLELNKKDSQCVEEMCSACWDFVVELKRRRGSLAESRESIAEKINAMILWGSPALAFIRKELVDQLSECLKQGRDGMELTSYPRMNDLVSAYERMVQRCGECHPQALRAFLSLPLPEQAGKTADVDFWRHVLETGALKLNQLTQLASARHSLMVKMQQLVARRKEIACLVQTGGQELAGNQQPLFGSIAQSQLVLDLHAQILKDERSAVFNFLAIVRLVLEPVQQAKLIVASHPFALDLLAICSVIAIQGGSLGMLNSNLALLSQLPPDSPFHALTLSRANVLP